MMTLVDCYNTATNPQMTRETIDATIRNAESLNKTEVLAVYRQIGGTLPLSKTKMLAAIRFKILNRKGAYARAEV